MQFVADVVYLFTDALRIHRTFVDWHLGMHFFLNNGIHCFCFWKFLMRLDQSNLDIRTNPSMSAKKPWWGLGALVENGLSTVVAFYAIELAGLYKHFYENSSHATWRSGWARGSALGIFVFKSCARLFVLLAIVEDWPMRTLLGLFFNAVPRVSEKIHFKMFTPLL